VVYTIGDPLQNKFKTQHRMKTTSSILCGLALLICAGPLKASSPVSADGYLVSPWKYEGQTIKLNVVCVKPAHFESPLREVIYYHAMTMNVDRRFGGEILIAVPRSESEHFARYYGLDPRGRTSRLLSGTLLLAHRPHPPFHRDQSDLQNSPGGEPAVSGTNPGDYEHPRGHESGIWFVDYKGLSADLFGKHKDVQLPEGGGFSEDRPHWGGPEGGPGVAPGGAPPGNLQN
jgi:hypothetical protein